MAHITVTVDIDEFDTDELIAELKCRNAYKKEYFYEDDGVEFKYQCDQLKYDFFMEHFDKFTLNDLEQLLKKK